LIAPFGRRASSHWRFFMAYPLMANGAMFIARGRPKAV
jgi:hypothetical protein